MGTKAVKGLSYFFWIVMTFVVALLLALGACARYVNPNNSTLMSALGEMMPGMIILNAIVALIWLFRKRIWTIVPIIAILINWSFLSAMVQVRFHEPPKGDFKIATYNVHSFNNDYTGYSAKEIARFMEEQNVDVLCFQEYSSFGHFTIDSVNAVFSNWKYFYYPEYKNGYRQLAVLSKHPIIASKFIPFKNNANCALWCDIVRGNDTVRIFNVHLQTTDYAADAHLSQKYAYDTSDAVKMIGSGVLANVAERAKQSLKLQQMIKSAANRPVAVCGDFNDIPSSFTYGTFCEVLKDGFKEGGSGYGATYKGLKRLLRIDYILTNDKIEAGKYQVFDKEWSDHEPVVMEMKIK